MNRATLNRATLNGAPGSSAIAAPIALPLVAGSVLVAGHAVLLSIDPYRARFAPG
jgi:hypothetical protein